MSRVVDALCWDGVYATLGMYAVFKGAPNMLSDVFSWGGIRPVRAPLCLVLEDEALTLGGRSLVYAEARLPGIPSDFSSYLNHCVAVTLRIGATHVWFAFEGSFDFDHLLTEDVANQVYCVSRSGGQAFMALEDAELLSEHWKTVIADQRDDLFQAQ